MTVSEDIRAHAEHLDAYVLCEKCGFREPMTAYMDRDGIVDEPTDTMHFECPTCGHGELGLQKGHGPVLVTVGGLPGLEMVF